MRRGEVEQARTPVVFEAAPPAGLAFVCHPYHRGGVTRWMVDAAVECARRRIPTWFVCPEPTREFLSAGGRPTVVSLLRRDGNLEMLRIVAPRVGWTYELGTGEYRALRYVTALRTAVPANVPVIVSDDPAAWAGAAKMSRRNPFIGVLHADQQSYYDLAAKYRGALSVLICVSRRIARRAAVCVAPSRPLIATIPCGIPLPDGARAMDAHSGPLELIWVGRIDEEQKRVSDLVRIAVMLREQSVPFRLSIIGDGPQRSWLESLVWSSGVGRETLFLGWQSTDAVRRRLEAADVFLLPSNFEGMPIAAMEALAAGCGLVATRVSGLEDYEAHPLADGVLRLFPVGDVAEAVRQVREIARIPAAQRVARSRAFAEAEFSVGRAVDQYLEVARAVVRPGGDVPLAKRRAARDLISRGTSNVVAGLRYARLRLAGLQRRRRVRMAAWA